MTKPVQTSNRYLFAREFVDPSKVGKQKIAEMAGAPTDDATKWQSIDWKYTRRQVRRLQIRIAKAVQENRWNKAKILQYKSTILRRILLVSAYSMCRIDNEIDDGLIHTQSDNSGSRTRIVKALHWPEIDAPGTLLILFLGTKRLICIGSLMPTNFL